MSHISKHPYETAVNWQPLQIIYKAALIAAISLILGVVVPGLVAHHGGVFYQSTMKPKLPDEAKGPLDKFDMLQDEARKQIKHIDDLLLQQASIQPQENLTNLLSMRSYYQKELESANPPIQAVPFYLNPLMFVWVAMYTALGWLVFILPPWRKSSLRPFRRLRTTIAIAIGIYIMYQWPVWMRNFGLKNDRRVVYAFANYDIYPASFFAQEVNTIIFAVLLAVLWQQWSSFFLIRRNELAEPKEGDFCDAAFDYSTIERLSKTYIRWQIVSLILALGFIAFSSGFWDLVVHRQDQRYLIAAVIIHVLWGITWILISLPLLVTWYHWQAIRVRAFSEIANGTSKVKGNVDTTIKVLSDIKPIGFWNVATSGIVALISFALPIIQAFFK